ncbi:TPA: hypothetical protein ACXIC2_000098 [Stenotrophomonas maltophilia]
MKPEVWAAWWQAILSAVAIFAAARIAYRQERRQVKRRADFYVSLLDSAAQAAEKTLTTSMAGLADIKAVAYPAAYRFDQLAKALDAALLQELPDPRLLPSIQSAAAACHTLRMLVDQVAKLEKWTEDFSHIQKMRTVETGLVAYYNEAAAVANEHHVRSLKEWVSRVLSRLGGRPEVPEA